MCFNSIAQNNSNVVIVVTADRANRTYKVGETPHYSIEIKGENSPEIEKLKIDKHRNLPIPENEDNPQRLMSN